MAFGGPWQGIIFETAACFNCIFVIKYITGKAAHLTFIIMGTPGY